MSSNTSFLSCYRNSIIVTETVNHHHHHKYVLYIDKIIKVSAGHKIFLREAQQGSGHLC